MFQLQNTRAVDKVATGNCRRGKRKGWKANPRISGSSTNNGSSITSKSNTSSSSEVTTWGYTSLCARPLHPHATSLNRPQTAVSAHTQPRLTTATPLKITRDLCCRRNPRHTRLLRVACIRRPVQRVLCVARAREPVQR